MKKTRGPDRSPWTRSMEPLVRNRRTDIIILVQTTQTHRASSSRGEEAEQRRRWPTRNKTVVAVRRDGMEWWYPMPPLPILVGGYHRFRFGQPARCTTVTFAY